MQEQLHRNEEWVKFDPQNITGTFYACYTEITKEEDAMKFTVICEKHIIEILFYGLTPIYMWSDEGMRMATYMPIQEEKHDKKYFQKWFLYKVYNSDFMSWALKESCGFYQENELLHFCIITENDVVDILSTTEPEIVIRKVNE